MQRDTTAILGVVSIAVVALIAVSVLVVANATLPLVTISALLGFAGTVIGVIQVINGRKLEQIHSQINSRMDQLLKLTSDASRAEGKLEEKDSHNPR